jgi:hypothetical protein
MNLELLAQKILEIGDLEEPTYTLGDLFRIRDALEILNTYNLADIDLLKEVNKFILQKIEELNDKKFMLFLQ